MRRLMEYRIISGRTVETKRSWVPVGPAWHKPRGTRRAGASSEAKIRANEKSSIMNLARTINCNFGPGDWFITFKYDDRHYPSGESGDPDQRREEEFQKAKLIWKKFMQKMRKAYQSETGKKLPAVWVTANWSTKRKYFCRIHHHAVFPSDALPMAERIWKELGGTDGTLYLETLNAEGDYTRIAAYMVDNVQGRPSGENRWSACRGMAKPIYTEFVEVSDVEDVQPLPDGIIKDVMHYEDEDGRTVSSYMRQVMPEKVKVRGGQIILPKRRGRKLNE